MKDWTIILKAPSYLKDLEQVATVSFFSKLANVAIIRADEEIISCIRTLPGIAAVSEPKMGTFDV